MFGEILLFVICVAFLIFGIPLTALICGFVAVVITSDASDGPVGAFVGYILGIILWIVALTVAIIQVLNWLHGT